MVMKTVHWIIAVVAAFEVGVGSFMVKLIPMLKGIIVPLHFVAGLALFVLTLVLLAWRLTHRSTWPAANVPRNATGWLMSGALYVALLTMSAEGWAIVSAHPWKPGQGENIWGWFILPPIAPIAHIADSSQRILHTALVQFHTIGGWVFAAVLLLHSIDALRRGRTNASGER